MNKIKMTNIDGSISYLEIDSVLMNDRALAQKLLYGMYLARFFEQKVDELYADQLIHGTMHLAIGQEASSIGTTAAMQNEDKILVTHRGHCEVLGKGVDPYAMFCELLSKKDGTCKGFGGSMHMIDLKSGVMHANGIVAANAPLACGIAFALKKQQKTAICACYIGDGGMNEGAYYESLNLASLWKLPLVFITVNNQYGMSTAVEKSHANIDFSQKGISFNLPALAVDGNDVLAVYQAMQKARKMALRFQPVILVLNTYRLSGHSRSDKNLYRTEEEIEEWAKKCPIKNFSEFCLTQNLLTDTEIEQMKKTVRQLIDEKASEAKAAEPVNAADALAYVYQETASGDL